MEIELWEGGLLAHEVDAIEKIEKHFQNNNKKTKKPVQNSSLKEQLAQVKNNSIFPWKGYAGFRFVDKGQEGEFDLVIVTHCNVLIIELKDWNFGEITARGDKWYKNNQEMGRSPVSVTRNKKYLLERKLDKYKNQFSNKGFRPFVHFLVVMTGNACIDKLPETDKEHTMSLESFLKMKNEGHFNKKFEPKHSKQKVLNQDFHIFDKLFDRKDSNIQHKHIVINGYKAIDELFSHPKGAYKEFSAVSEVSAKDEALLRLWDFNQVSGQNAKTSEGRFKIISRERTILGLIKHQNYDLYKYCLTSLTSVQKDDVTAQYSELYELPPSHVRFNEFIGKFCVSFTEADRLNVVKLLFAKFADLHELKIAHRDLGDHSIWVSPSKEIALSNFISAYHQPLGTVGDYRQILSVNDGLTPFEMKANDQTTPFKMDVYALAILAWHILQGKRLSPKSLKGLQSNIEQDTHWYASILSRALAQDLTDARALFDALKIAEPKIEQNLDFDISALEIYKQNIKISRQYPEDEFLSETDDKEVYLSNGLVVKEWLNINPTSDNVQLGYKTLHFLERLAKLKSLSPPYIPRVHEFGLATRSGSLFLVMEQVDGINWGEIPVLTNHLELVKNLLSSVEHLHGLHISHGDLHPENVLVDLDENSVWLIDIPDFCGDGNESKNHRYSPENIDSCTAFERDNYAVMRLSAELLGIEWAELSEKYPVLSKAITVELEDHDYGFKSLERFKDAINSPINDESFDLVEITTLGNFEELTIYPDNGKVYLEIEKDTKNPNEARITFKGVGGNVPIIYSPFEQGFRLGFAPRIRSSVGRRDIESANLEIPFGLKISSSRRPNLDALNRRLSNNEELSRAVEFVLRPEQNDVSDVSTEELKLDDSKAFDSIFGDGIAPVNIDEPNEIEVVDEINEIKTHQLWQSILDTETESHPNIELIETQSPKDQDNQLILHHKSEKDPLASFTKTDVIEALLSDGEKEDILGEVLLKPSTSNEVRLGKIRNRAKRLDENDIIYFRSKADKASFTKRKNALERILAKESTISRLVDYFEPKSALTSSCYDIEVTDSDFERYDRTDDHGNEISLNSQQREAFQKLVNYGPLSLLQGPPGTGKTEFIAAFVHYLVEKQQVNNVLLVSQSHEAVNTAAERIRKHCLNLKTPLDVVRFSNRESVVSDGLKDVYSNAIITEKRELFSAESTYRTASLSQALGLDPEYLSAITRIELKLFKQIDELAHLSESLDTKKQAEADKKGLTKSYNELKSVVDSSLKEDFSIDMNTVELADIKNLVWKKLQTEYSIRPDEEVKARALAKISRDMLDVLAADRVNYDEFFARSRQLVTGTCVGIGQHHIGISENQYDWVIIDEAARSIASELAIAMQSGKRVLLVGDHKQLPPLYSEPHKKAIARKLGLVVNDSEDLLQSDFERAFESNYGKEAGAKLLTQYRMAKPIGDLVSQCFYNSELATGKRKIPDIYQNVPKALQSVVTWLDTTPLGKVSHHTKSKAGSLSNRAEADEVISLLKEIANSDNFTNALAKTVKDTEPAIGVICMYGEQKRLIRKRFNEQSWDDDFKALVKIDTVDSYQGKENRIIILSITRSCTDLSCGFLRLPNRINVALSRAMDRLVIVGASQMWRGKNSNKPLGKVIEYIESQTEQSIYKVLNIKTKRSKGVRR
ncbi:AAA domain-containing protein [Colwellia psychrerythraea]|uniref:NERD domain protein n=1 Tax=Colwellia psychrerythraea TaxID=28229 RepID=A0A099KFV9_COLPS|nr:AAA domain-containing protein [Colwellia psychrerythraea]KGJ89624.1 NERD domain protein [Colwellia psychrerythraea]